MQSNGFNMRHRHRALSWLCGLVFKECGYTAGENLGEIRMGLPGSPDLAVCPWDTAPSTGSCTDLTAGKLGMAHPEILGRIPWGRLFGWWFPHLDLGLGYLK